LLGREFALHRMFFIRRTELDNYFHMKIRPFTRCTYDLSFPATLALEMSLYSALHYTN